MGAVDLPFRRVTDLDTYVQSCFTSVLRGPEDMRDYQNTAVQFLLDNPYSALFIDVGMGKSVISLTAILNLITQFDCDYPWLVIAPKRVSNETWPTEIREWRHTAPLTFVHVRADEVVDAVNAAGRAERRAIEEELLWEGKAKAEVKELLKASLSLKDRIEKARLRASRVAVREHFRRNPAVVHIVNREQVEFLVDAWGRDWPYKGVLIDESSCFKDHSTNRFKALRRVRPLIKRLHELTATPASETYEHLFAQIYLLDEGKRLGKSITKYRERYFTQNRYTFKWKLRPGAEEEISGLIADLCLVMKAEDYLDLEKPVSLIDKVFLNADQQKLYEEMARESIVTLPNGAEVEAETAAALSQKLAQMASGVLYETVMEDVGGVLKKRRVVHHLHDHKIDALEAIVEETSGECLIVSYWHDSSRDRLLKAFPKAVVMDKDGKCVKDWNARKIPMILMHPMSSAHGLNMQKGGRRIVFFDIPWSLELYEQLIGRLAGARQLARAEHERVVFLHHLVTQGTIDEDIVEGLIEKRDLQELLFRLLKKLRKLISGAKFQKSVNINFEL